MLRKLPTHTFRMVGMALAVTFLLAGCGKGCGKEQAGPSAKSSTLSLIPAGNNVLIGINLKKLQASPFGAKVKEKMPPEMAPFVENIEGITIGVTAKGMGQEPEGAVGIIEGKLDQAQLLAKMSEQAKKDGGDITNEEYNGVKIYSGPKDPDVGLAFVESVAVVGKKPGVKSVIDLSQKKGDSVESDANLMSLLKAVDSTKMLWAVAVVPAGAIPGGGGGGGPGNPMAALSNIKAIDLAMDMSDKLTLDLGVIAGSADDAKQMENMANSYKTLFGASLAQKEPKLGEVLSGMTVSSEGDRVVLNLQVEQSTVEELSQKAAGGMAGGPGAELEDGPMDEGSGDEMPPAEDGGEAAPEPQAAEPDTAQP